MTSKEAVNGFLEFFLNFKCLTCWALTRLIASSFFSNYNTFTAICKKAGVPVQVFANRADVPGGSTLGNLLGHQILMPMVDIGLGQLAMHSAMETASCADAEYMAKAVAEYYNTPIFQPKDGEWKLGL